MKTSEFLRQAKAVIDTPEKWTKNAMARNAAGTAVHQGNKLAVCWCLSGAVNRQRWAMPDLSITESGAVRDRADAFLETVARRVGFQNAVVMNDHHLTTHDEVMGLFDDAIVLAEREGD